MRSRIAKFLAATLVLSGCGLGLFPSGGAGIRLAFSTRGLASIRKNDCTGVEVTLLRKRRTGPSSVTVSVSVSAGAKTYRSLAGCQTYDSGNESTTVVVDSVSLTGTLYVRTDTPDTLVISASAPGSGLSASPLSVPVRVESLSTPTGLSDNVYCLAVGTDDLLYAGGTFLTANDKYVARVARFSTDSTFDPSFLPTGTGLNSSVSAIAVQADGKVIVGGAFTSYNGISRPYLARLNTEGSLDTGFVTTGSGLNAAVYAIALQADGQILVGGSFTQYNGAAVPYLTRLNTDGTLDPSFSQTGTGLSSVVTAIAVQSDGKILVGGAFTDYNGSSRIRLARLNSNGTLDGSLTLTGTGFNSTVLSLAVQPDGKIIVGGDFTTYNVTSRNFIARLNADGTLDATFVVGTGFNLDVSSLVLQPDGKVLAAGTYSQYQSVAVRGLVRLNSDGSRDSSFVPNGVGGNAFSVARRSDGSVAVGGDFTSYGTSAAPYLAFFDSAGSFVAQSTQNTVAPNGRVEAVATQPDGKTLLGGAFTAFDGASAPYLMRLNADGSRDPSFSLTGTGFDLGVLRIAIQPDGKIVVGGYFTSYNGTARPAVARLNGDGSLDTSFVQTGTGLNSWVYALDIQPDGKVLVGGIFNSYNGTARSSIARLNADGSLDTSFVVGTGLNSAPTTIKVQPDGKILVAGYFSQYNGSAVNYLVRLNSDGTRDGTLTQTGAGFNSFLFDVGVQSDGKILAAGAFTQYAGTSVVRIARLNGDGTLDSGFIQTGTGLNSSVRTLAVESSGKIAVGGSFSSYNGTTVGSFARLNSDGSLDSLISPTGTGLSQSVYSIAPQSDGKYLVGGNFGYYDTVSAANLARLTYIGTLD